MYVSIQTFKLIKFSLSTFFENRISFKIQNSILKELVKYNLVERDAGMITN